MDLLGVFNAAASFVVLCSALLRLHRRSVSAIGRQLRTPGTNSGASRKEKKSADFEAEFQTLEERKKNCPKCLYICKVFIAALRKNALRCPPYRGGTGRGPPRRRRRRNFLGNRLHMLISNAIFYHQSGSGRFWSKKSRVLGSKFCLLPRALASEEIF